MKELTHIDLFSGIGGFALAARWAGIRTVQFVEIDPFCQKVLQKNFKGVPIHDDIKTFHWGDKCEVTNNKWQIDEILNSHKKQSDQGELFFSVNNAENHCQFLQAPISGEGHIEDFAPINAVMNLSGEITHLTQTVGSGCGEIETLTIKMEGQKNVNKNGTKMEKLKDGGVGSLQGINTSAKYVDTTKGNYSMPTTLNRGKTTRKNDSTLTTESRYANNVTRSNTGEIFLLTAGTPCQPASCAGKRGGHNDDRWLWEETFRVIAEVKPRWCILENVAGILSLEQGVVFDYLLTSLENQGFETQTYLLPACAVNAPHRRDRVWIVAHSFSNAKGSAHRGISGECRCGRQESDECKRNKVGSNTSDSDCHAPDTEHDQAARHGQDGGRILPITESEGLNNGNQWEQDWYSVALRTCVRGVDDGVSRGLHRVNRLKALGNAVVPQIPYLIMKAILEVTP
jgi:DNA (cytosine-5)-methyltransferase 1